MVLFQIFVIGDKFSALLTMAKNYYKLIYKVFEIETFIPKIPLTAYSAIFMPLLKKFAEPQIFVALQNSL